MSNVVVIWFDMDGVLAKWNEKATIEEVSSPGYFLNCVLEQKVATLIDYLKNYQSEYPEFQFEIRILTSVYQNGYAQKEKEQWLKNHKIDVPVTFVPYGESKFKFVNEDDTNILVDDFGKNLKEWIQNGFIGVKFYNGINDRPRMIFDSEGTGTLIQDSWIGPSIDYRMSVRDMASVILGQLVA